MRNASAALLLLLASCGADAASSCPGLYPHGVPPEVPGTVELCSSFYVAVYDPVIKANLFSSEALPAGAGALPRTESFRADQRLAPSARAELSDYRNSGYDRGHAAPSDDASTEAEMRDTYLLSNVTPQAPRLNRYAWAYLELRVRRRAPSYVVTGAVYPAKPKYVGGNRIPVPASYWKCAWYATGVVECFTAENRDSATVTPAALEEVNALTGMRLY